MKSDMICMQSENFTELYFKLLEKAVSKEYTAETSRNGKVFNLGRAVFSIENDNFRMPILLHRRLNPFFAIVEAAWILNGSNLVSPLKKYIKNFDQYSDDGKTLNGAYGYRLKKYFETDQLEKSIYQLAKNNNTRRVVLQLWSPNDLDLDSLDIPCNTQVMLKINNNKLDLTVINRSNDLFLGVPYNVFTFFILQKYISYRLNIEAGVQTHFTDSLHIYDKDVYKVKNIVDANSGIDFEFLKEKNNDFNWSFYQNKKTLNELININFEEIDDFNFYCIHSYVSLNSTLIFSPSLLKDAKNSLVLCALLWHFGLKDEHKISNTYGMLFMKKDRYFFEKFNKLTTEKLTTEALSFANLHKDIQSSVTTFFADNLLITPYNEEKNLHIFFLASVLLTVDLIAIHPSELANIKNNFESASMKLGLNYGYVTQATTFVEKFNF